MTRRIRVAAVLAALLVCTPAPRFRVAAADSIPSRLGDQEFWSLIADVSEPSGSFRSDNLLSNEIWFQHALPDLMRMTRPGRAYIGVGPEQNFTYALALKPSIAFIVDIRRGNLDLHLMYKALFELSHDRVDFVSRLFSRKRPAGLASTASITRIFEAMSAVRPTENEYTRNLAEIRSLLMTRHRFDLPPEDLDQLEFIYRAFYSQGPDIRYSPYGVAGGTIQPTYAELMAATDESGVMRGFLSSEAAFAAVKDLEARNLIVPVVGNFGGAKAIRAIGSYLKERGTMVAAFYVSNVEQYLRQDGLWNTFCANVASLPLDASSTFIRSVPIIEPNGSGNGFTTELKPIPGEVQACQPAAAVR